MWKCMWQRRSSGTPKWFGRFAGERWGFCHKQWHCGWLLQLPSYFPLASSCYEKMHTWCAFSRSSCRLGWADGVVWEGWSWGAGRGKLRMAFGVCCSCWAFVSIRALGGHVALMLLVHHLGHWGCRREWSPATWLAAWLACPGNCNTHLTQCDAFATCGK